MSGVLWHIKARFLSILASTFSLATIFGCYLIAVGQGHVPAWLPMISDCAVYPPESYFFRIGIILGAGLLVSNCILMLLFRKDIAPEEEKKRTGSGNQIDFFDKFSFTLAFIGCSGLATVGAVNEVENTKVHGAAAVAFFACFLIYMVLVTGRLWHNSSVKSESLYIKLFLTVYGITAFLIFALCSSNWGKYGIIIAFVEWTGTIGIILFNLSFCYEYGSTLDLGAILNTSMAKPQQQHVIIVQSVPFVYAPLPVDKAPEMPSV